MTRKLKLKLSKFGEGKGKKEKMSTNFRDLLLNHTLRCYLY